MENNIDTQFQDEVSSQSGNPIAASSNLEPSVPSSTQSQITECTEKGKKLTSSVWDDMKRKKNPDGTMTATCNHCKTVLSSKSGNGTSHLKRHLESCVAKTNHPIKNYCISGSLAEAGSELKNRVMSTIHPTPSLDAIRDALSILLVACALPFTLVETPGFKYFMNVLAPHFQQLSRKTVQRDVLKQHSAEKSIVSLELKNAPGRICFTTDNWRSEHSEYMCITAHWIDKHWKLQKRIIKFGVLNPPFDGESLAEEILLCLGEWKIADKVFSFTLDNASYNNTMMGSLKSHLLKKHSLVLSGEFFHIRCSCHIINLIVQAGLKVIDDVVLKIRRIVSYLKKSGPKRKKFYEIATTNFGLNVKKRIRGDTPTRWNSTYTMLDHFVYFREAIESFVSRDADLKGYQLSAEEWEKVSQLKKFLCPFYEVTNEFSASNTPTANIYFRGVWKLHKLLMKVVNGAPSILSTMVSQMEVKFEKYWEEYSLLLSCAAVLDPRLKLEGVAFLYERMFGYEYAQEMVKKIKGVLLELLYEYKVLVVECDKSSNSNSHIASNRGGSSSKLVVDVDCESESDEDILLNHMNKRMRIESKSELDLYLDEKTASLKEQLNILQFWKRSSIRYPILSCLARDILCIPISSVPSESAFSLGKKIITSCRSSLNETTAEALACYEDWLRSKGLDYPGQSSFKIGDASVGFVEDDEDEDED